MKHSGWRRRAARAGLVALLTGGCVLACAGHGLAARQAATRLAAVMYIDRGLQVQSSSGHSFAGKVKDPLFDRYGLRTQHQQRAAIGFNDGTTFHMNQQTDAVLTDPHHIEVKHGEIAVYLKPGSSHSVATQAALATAIGTVYDLQISKDDSTYIVVHGALQVKNRFGSVVVETNQETTAGPDHAPTPPRSVNGQAAIDWTAGMPRAHLGENMALAADGGSIVGFSSQDIGVNHDWDAGYAIDGLPERGWRSAPGKTTNQSITFAFPGHGLYRISDLIIDPAATGGNPSAADVRQFTLLVSTTGIAASDFSTVATGTCRRAATLQDFHFPRAQPARYAELVLKNNYGGTRYVELSEVELVALPMG